MNNPDAPPHPKAGTTNSTAIASLAFLIIFMPLSLILGPVALVQIKRRAQTGAWMAMTAIAISYTLVVMGIAVALTTGGAN